MAYKELEEPDHPEQSESVSNEGHGRTKLGERGVEHRSQEQ